MNKRKWCGRAICILVTLALLLPLGIIAVPMALMIEAAELAEYTATELQDWLIDQIESSTISLATAPVVSLDVTNQTMVINAAVTARGTTVELNNLKFTFDDTNTVGVSGEISALEKSPRFSCEAEIECEVADKIPQVNAISNIVIAGFTPSLSPSTVSTITDTINRAIQTSGLKIESLGGNLTGITVVTDGGAKLELKWDGGSMKLDVADIESKLNMAATDALNQANNYLSTGHNDGKWSLSVSIGDDKLRLEAEASGLDRTIKIENMDIYFSGAIASFVDALLSLESKQTTVSGTAKIACTDYIPYMAMRSISVGEEYPEFKNWIEDTVINAALMDTLNRLVMNVIADTDLSCRIKRFNNIAIRDETLRIWWHEEAPPSGGPSYYTLETSIFGIEEDFRISSTGKMLETIEVSSEDGMYTITIPKDTICLDKNGKRLKILTAVLDEDPPQPPENAYIIGLVYRFGPEGANFDPPITLTWKYDPKALPEGVTEENLTMAYYDQETGQWLTLKSVGAPENDIITALVEHLATFAIFGYITPPEQAIFSVSNLYIRPSEIYPGDTVTISVSVNNSGGQSGTHTVMLKIDGEVEARKDITIAADTSRTVSFIVVKEKPGIYQVAIDGLKRSFTVEEAVAPSPPSRPPTWISRYYWIVLIGAVVATLLACLLWWRRR